MKMLRQWNGDSLLPIHQVIAKFGFLDAKVSLYKYEVLSPDSFIWVLYINDKLYCLYAEDYVQSLDQVTEAMCKHGGLDEESGEHKLVKVKNPKTFDQASPFKSSDIYIPPKDIDEFMKYAADSGCDFVFLGKSTRN